jgi:hypothetical protein
MAHKNFFLVFCYNFSYTKKKKIKEKLAIISMKERQLRTLPIVQQSITTKSF